LAVEKVLGARRRAGGRAERAVELSVSARG
jgi:hypothetical protein